MCNQVDPLNSILQVKLIVTKVNCNVFLEKIVLDIYKVLINDGERVRLRSPVQVLAITGI